MLQVTIEDAPGGLAAVIGNDRIEIGRESVAARPALAGYAGRPVILGIRPEDMEDAALAPDASGEHRIRGVVRLREALGSQVMVHVTVKALAARTEETEELAADSGSVGSGGVFAGEGTLITAAFNARSRVSEGDIIEAVVDTRNLHFFDPDTGLGIYGNTTNGSGGST
jgi:multiple sugar transport system ATP-binding protein